jgi:hypothetical protein
MMKTSNLLVRVGAWFGVGLLALTAPLFAAQFETMGDYMIHYNAVNTSLLQPEIARSYKIVRSKNRAFLNVSIRKKGAGDAMQDSAVNGNVSATATNLSKQLQNVDMREIHDGGAIYYIGVFNISNAEVLDFEIQVDPEVQGQSHTIKFRQTFFTDDK